MSPKAGMSLAVIVGSTIGSYIPLLWGASFLSYTSVLFGGIGGLLGIYIAYKIYF